MYSSGHPGGPKWKSWFGRNKGPIVSSNNGVFRLLPPACSSGDREMRRRRLVLFAAGVMVTHVAGQRFQPVALGQEEVVVQQNAELQETDYKIAAENCTITWTMYSSELNRGGISQHSDCALSLAGQAPLIAKLLRKVPKTGEAGQVHTFFWGRLYPYGNPGTPDPTMAMRLALAAKRSPQWDSARGRPRSGKANGWVDVNGCVRTLGNDAAIYIELQRVFAEARLELRLSSVEKVLIFRAGEMPFFEALQKSGVRASDLLPFDCLTWFSVRPMGKDQP